METIGINIGFPLLSWKGMGRISSEEKSKENQEKTKRKPKRIRPPPAHVRPHGSPQRHVLGCHAGAKEKGHACSGIRHDATAAAVGSKGMPHMLSASGAERRQNRTFYPVHTDGRGVRFLFSDIPECLRRYPEGVYGSRYRMSDTWRCPPLPGRLMIFPSKKSVVEPPPSRLNAVSTPCIRNSSCSLGRETP